ncbi:MAG: caspase family protein [Desulfobacterales bacterium]|jgi:WD40 repeat protein
MQKNIQILIWVTFGMLIFVFFVSSNSAVADTSQVFVQLGHSKDVTSVAFSPDGTMVVSGSQDNTVKVWDVTSGREIVTLKGHKNMVWSVDFSPDGNFVISGSRDGFLILWDILSGKKIRTMGGNKGQILTVKFHKSGKYALSGSNAAELKLWDLKSGRAVRIFKGHTKHIKSLDFSPDGKYIVSGGSDKSVRVWNIRSGKSVRTFSRHTNEVKFVRFINGGKHIVSEGYDSLRIWDRSTGREIKVFKREPLSASCLALSPDGKKILDNNLNFVNLANGRTIKKMKESYLVINSAAFSPDGARVIAGSDKQLVLLDMGTGNRIRTFKGHADIINTIASNPASARFMLSGSQSGKLSLWDIERGQKIRQFKEFLSQGSNKSQTVVFDPGDPPIKAVAFSPKGKYAISGYNSGLILLWDIASGKVIKSFKEKCSLSTLAFSPDNTKFISGGGVHNPVFGQIDTCFTLWDIASGQAIRSFDMSSKEGHQRMVCSVAFSPDGKTAISSSEDKTIKIWDISSAREIRSFKWRKGACYSLAYGPDGRTILSGSWEGTFILWNVASGKVIRTFKGHNHSINSVAFSPDGKTAISGDNVGRVKHWDIHSGQEIQSLKGHFGSITSLSFNRDGSRIISGSEDGTIRIWDSKTGREIAQMICFKDEEWIIITPEGFYNCSPKGDKHLNVRAGKKVYSIEQFYGIFYRPDLVYAKLQRGADALIHQNIAKVDIKKVIAGGAPPAVSFVSPDMSKMVSQRDITITIELTNQGGGIGKLEWKINGITVGVQEEKRGISVKKRKGRYVPIRKSKLITLSPGENIIRIAAYNAKNQITSVSKALTLTLKDEISSKPTLYLLTIAINSYRDKSLWLKYSVPDAESIASAFQNYSHSIFTDVSKTNLFDNGATYTGIDNMFDLLATKVQPYDVFVLYIAGHGVTLDGRYHFLPYDFRYRNENSIRNYAINQDHFQQWLSRIKARKSLILMDTCNSGSFTKAQFIQRGITEKTAIDKLTRATGRATIVASKDDQPALEGFKGHGIFTYVLLSGLKEADTRNGNRDRLTSIHEMAAYIDEHVPEITFKAFGYEQVPQLNMMGRDFPIAVTQ